MNIDSFNFPYLQPNETVTDQDKLSQEEHDYLNKLLEGVDEKNSLLKEQKIYSIFTSLDIKSQKKILASVASEQNISDQTIALINTLYFSKEAHISALFSIQPPAVVTWNDLKTGPVMMSLEQYIARYFGDENFISLSVASQWLHHYAQQIFADSAMFFRELVANAFDAQLPRETQIGNFGVGFYSVFSQFYQKENQVGAVIITTCYMIDKEKKAYQMTFKKDENEYIQVEWTHLPFLNNLGTTVCLKPISNSFSQEYLNQLKQTLSQFCYFKHGHILIGDNEIIGNEKTKIGVSISFDSDSVTVKDDGCGIDLLKIQQLLIPSISSKRRPSQEVKYNDTPSATIHPTNAKTSSFIFTINSVVNSFFSLERVFTEDKINCDLVVDLCKAFKPTLSRNGIVIPCRKSPEAKALKKMIKEVVIDAFSNTKSPSPRLLMLFLGLSKWEQTRLPSELKGFFTGYLSAVLKKEFFLRPNYFPCQDIQSVIDLKDHLFDEQSHLFIPLPQEIILDGYTGFELAVVNRYQERLSKNSPHHELFMKASNKEMIQGLSVLFLEDQFTEGKVSCGPFGSLLLVPLSILKDAQTLSDLQTEICWRFRDDGRQIQAATEDSYQNAFPSVFSVPYMKIQTNEIFRTLNTPLFQSYIENVDKFLESPFIQSLDIYEGVFLDYYSDLPKFMKRPCGRTKRSLFFSLSENNDNVDDHTLLQQTIIIDDEGEVCKGYRLKPGADIKNKLEELYSISEIIDQTDYFDEVSEDELYKRLVILLLIYEGLDPLKKETLCYVKDGKTNEIDQDFLKIYICNTLEKFKPSRDFDDLSPLLIGCYVERNPLIFDPAVKIAKFYPLLSNLKFFMPKEMERNLLSGLIDLSLLLRAAPSHCASYLEQIVELYYQYLCIPAREFPCELGTKIEITLLLEPTFFLIPQAVCLLRSLHPPLAKKLLQALTEDCKSSLCKKKRADLLKKNNLNIPLLTGRNALYLTIKCHQNQENSIPLLNYILSLGDTYEEITALLLIATYAQNHIPQFFDTPFDYQKESLSLIFQQVIRLGDLSFISSWIKKIYNEREIPSISILRVGIDCISLFTERYQHLADIDPVFFQNPDILFEKEGVSPFFFTQWMEAFLNNPISKEALTSNSVKNLLTLIRNTPVTERFTNFGMLSHMSTSGNGHAGWKKPIFELLKNTQEALVKSVSSTQFQVDYKIEPCDANEAFFVYEVSDLIGFKNLESLMSLIIPNYHPTDPTKLGSGFFRMLTDVEFYTCTTRLQEEPEVVITLFVKPLRDNNGNIHDLKIGLKANQSDLQNNTQGSLFKIYLRKATHVECLMREKEAKYYIFDELLNPMHLLGPNKQNLSYVINGIKQKEPKFVNYIDNRKMNPLSKIQGGFICNKNNGSSFLLIEGIPQPIKLNRFLIEQGLLDASFEKIDLGIEGISLSKECFEQSYDIYSFILKTDVRQDIQQSLLNMFYLRLFYKEQAPYIYLDHYGSSCSDVSQMIITPTLETKKLEDMLMQVNNKSFYNKYILKFLEETQNGSYKQAYMPSFSTMLCIAYKEVYQTWIEAKKSGKNPSLSNKIKLWKHEKMKTFEHKIGSFFYDCFKSLLEHVEGWYSNKLHAIEQDANRKNMLERETKASQIDLEKDITQHPHMIETKKFVEEILQYYVDKVLEFALDEDKKQILSSKRVTVSLFYSKDTDDAHNTLGFFNSHNSEICINLTNFPFSKLIDLLADLKTNYKNGFLDSNTPTDAGLLNHEIYHAQLYLSGKEDNGHPTSDDGASFEVQAREMAAAARQNKIFFLLENKLSTLLQEKNWTINTLKNLAEETKKLEH